MSIYYHTFVFIQWLRLNRIFYLSIDFGLLLFYLYKRIFPFYTFFAHSHSFNENPLKYNLPFHTLSTHSPHYTQTYAHHRGD